MAAGSDRQLRLDLLARDQSGPATRSFSRNLDDVADAADDAGKATERLGEASDKATDRVKGLDQQIATIKQNLVFLHEAMGDAQDRAEQLDIAKGIRRAEADLKRITRSRDVLKDLLPDPEPAARSFMVKLGSGLAAGGTSIATKAGASIGPTLGIAIGTAAAPVVIAGLGSALAAGTGVGVLGGAVALALKDDDELAAAGKRTGQRFMQSLTKGVRDTGIRREILQVFGILDDAGERSVKKFTGNVSGLRSSVVPLTRDIVQGVESITDAVLDTAAESGPALAGFGDSWRLLADGVGDFIRVLADGGPEAADNLRLIAGATGDVLRYSGLVLKTFSDLSNNAWLTGPLLPILRSHYKDVAEESDTLAGSTTELAGEMSNAERAARGQTSALAGLSKELRSQTDPVFAVLNATDQLDAKQKAYNETVKKHGKNSEEAKRANRELAEAALTLSGRVGELGAKFDGTMTPALRATLRAAGLTDAQINGLERQFKEAKAAGDRFAKNYRANVNVSGYETAYRRLWSVRDIARDIPRAVTIAMRVTGTSNVSAAAAAVRKQYGREFGGPVKKGHAYVVGEKRAEVFVPDRDGRIIPSLEQYARAGGRMPAGAGMAAAGGAGWVAGGGAAAGATVAVQLVATAGADGRVANFINGLIRDGMINVVAA